MRHAPLAGQSRECGGGNLARSLVLWVAGCCMWNAPSCPAQRLRPAATPAPFSGVVASGEKLLGEHRYGEAMTHFEAALATSPQDDRARKGEIAAASAWAADQDRTQHPEAAMQILERAIERLPSEADLLLSFGLEAITLGQFPIAEQALHAAKTLRPKDPMMTYAFARLELEEQHLPEAERDLKAYLAARPEDATAYFGLGHVYAMEQRDDEARQAFRTSVRLQPRQTESYYQLGQIDLNLQQDAEASAEFGKVLARSPNHAGALTGMGELALRAKRFAEAEQYLALAEKSDPAYAPPHYYRGLALAKLGRTEEARAELRAGDSRPHAANPEATSSP